MTFKFEYENFIVECESTIDLAKEDIDILGDSLMFKTPLQVKDIVSKSCGGYITKCAIKYRDETESVKSILGRSGK